MNINEQRIIVEKLWKENPDYLLVSTNKLHTNKGWINTGYMHNNRYIMLFYKGKLSSFNGEAARFENENSV